MWTNPLKPNLADYASFLTSNVGIPVVNLPNDFTGTGTLEAGSAMLTIASALTGILYGGASIGDAARAIPADATILTQLSGATGGAGTYQMSGPALADQTAESVFAYNSWVVTTLEIARDIVNLQLSVSPRIYTLAVYNLAADRLITYAQDIPNQTYFADLRGPKGFKLASPSVGVVTSTFDQGTGTTVLNPESMKNLTLANLQMLKTPWGIVYMGFAQSIGTLWGMS